MKTMRKTWLVGSLPLILMSSSALGGLNGVDVNITNDGTEDVVVTVYDTSTRPQSIVLAHERINGFTQIPISLSPDAAGRGNLAWTAVSVDPNARKCGHAVRVGLTDSASIRVHADTECSGA